VLAAAVFLGLAAFPQVTSAQNYSFGAAALGNISSIIPSTTNMRTAPVLVDLGGTGLNNLNADGKLDLVVGSYDGTFRYYLNTGTATVPNFVLQSGGLNPLASFDVGLTANNDFSTPHFCDLDADGDLDMLSGDRNGTFHYYENLRINLADPINQRNYNYFEERIGTDNPMQYDMSNPATAIFSVGAYSTVGALDVDGDCDLDVVAGNASAAFYLFENFGDQHIPLFQTRVTATNPANNPPLHLPGAPAALAAASQGNSTVGIVDLDCDGIYDIMSGSREGKFYFRQLSQSLTDAQFASASPTNTANPFYQLPPSTGLDLTSSTTDYSYPAFGDLDGDGDLDAISGAVNGTLRFFRNNTCNTKPTLSFTSGGCGTTYTVALTASPQNLTAADIGSPTAASACAAPANTAVVDYAFNASSGCAASTNTQVSCDNIGATPTALTVRARNTITGVKSADCIVYVKVVDNVAPAITPPIPTTPPTPAGDFCSMIPYYIDLDANGMAVMGVVDPNTVPNDFADICPFTLSVVDQPPAQFQFNCSSITAPPFIPPNDVPYQIILRATDNAGNSGTCIANVVIRDVTGPSVTPSSLSTENLSICSNRMITADFTTPVFTVTDNCATTTTGTVSISSITGVTISGGGTGTDDVLPVTYTFAQAGTYTLTYTFTDGTNTTTLSQTIVVADAPIAFNPGCPTDQVYMLSYSNPTGCTATATWTPPQGVDCATGNNVSTIGTHTSGASFPLGTSTVVYTATSGSNTTQCYFTVTVVDDVDPVATWPSTTPRTAPTTGTFSNGVMETFPMSATSCGVVVNWTVPNATSVTDNCTPTASLTRVTEVYHLPPGGLWEMVTGFGPGSTFTAGSWDIYYYYLDASGNYSNDFNVSFEVLDNTFPTISCPSPINTVTAPGVCYADVYLPKPTLVSDNCTLPTDAVAGPTYGPPSQNYPSGSDFWRFEIGTTDPVNFTVTDASGNTTTCTMTVTVRDTEKPAFVSCPSDLVVSAGASCTSTQTITHPSITDNSLTCTVPGTITYTLIVTNPDGTTATTPLSVGAAPSFPITPATSSITFNEGITKMKYIVADASGNKDSCEYRVLVTNTIAPSFTLCPSFQGSIGTVNSDPGTCGIKLAANSFAAALGASGGGTGCDPGAFTFTNLVTNTVLPIGTVLPTGTHILLVKATDYSGSMATCQFRVTVADNQAPSTTSTLCGSTINVSTAAGLCTAVPSWTAPTFTDNCAVTSTTLTYIRNSPAPPTASAPYTGLPLGPGTYAFTYTARDAANLPGFCVFSVIIRDNERPNIVNCPTGTQYVNVNAPTACSATYTLTLNVTDNCTLLSTTLPVNMVVDLNSGTPLVPATLTSTFTAVDAAGNTRTCAITVQARDVSGPVIPTAQCPASQNLTIGSPTVCALPHPTGWADPAIGSMSDCTGPISMVSGPVALSATLTPIPVTGTAANRNASFPVGVNTVTYVYTDAASPANTSTCTFTVTVLERVPPVMTSCPNPITVDAPATSCSQTLTNAYMLALPAAQRPTATDLCSPSITFSTNLPAAGTVVAVGGCAMVTWTASDASSNTATCTQYVCVRDATPPVVTCGVPYTTTVLPGNTNVENNNNTYPTLLNPAFTPALPTFTDNCGNSAPPAIIGRLIGQPGQYPVGVHTLYWVVTDANGNTATCGQQITVLGNASCTPSMTAATYNAGQMANLGDISSITFTPSGCCSSPTVSAVRITAGPAGAGPYPIVVPSPFTYNFTVTGTYTIEYTINCTPFKGDDGAESEMVFTRTVTVVNCVPTAATFSPGSLCGSTLPFALPSVVCPANVTVTAAQLGITATDNCGNNLNIASQLISNVTASGNRTVTFTSPVGSATCTRVVTVTCGTACNSPLVVNNCPNPTIVEYNIVGSGCTIAVPWTVPTATDPCNGNATITGVRTGPAPGSTFTAGTETTVTYTFTRTSPAATATCSFIVRVNDGQNPTITCPPDVTVTTLPGEPATGYDLAPELAVYSDNCTALIDLSVIYDDAGSYPAGVHTIVYTVTDASNRIGTCAQTLTVVEDNQNCTEWDLALAAMVSGDAATAVSGDQYGESVDVSGDFAIVGASRDDERGLDAGAAYILHRFNGSWTQMAKLMPVIGGSDVSAAGDNFGISVGISGNYAVVGAPYDDDRGTNSGSAYLYFFNGTSWVLQAEVNDAVQGAAGDRFGFSVDIDGDFAAIGAPYDGMESPGTSSRQGSFYIYQRSGTSWNMLGKRRPSDVAPFDEFGTSVAIDGDYVIAGAPKDDETGTNSNSGAAFIFYKNQPTANAWGQAAKLLGDVTDDNDYFGTSVGISVSGFAVVGANMADNPVSDEGEAYVFQSVAPTQWVQTQRLDAVNLASSAQFGYSVDVENRSIVVGARNQTLSGIGGAGSAHFFYYDGSAWVPTTSVTHSTPASNDNFGFSVAVDACTAMVGAYRDDAPQGDRGSVFFYQSQCACANKPAPTVADRTGEKSELLGSAIRLYPNPTSDVLNIDLTLEAESEVTITVTDAAGRIVSQVFSGVAAPEARFTWDAGSVPAGLYFVRVDSDSLRKVVPVSVVK